MKVNKEQLEKLASKSDMALWAEIQEIASRHGLTIPPKMPSHASMEKLRSAMLGVEKINLADATKLINSYKNKK